MKWIFENFQIVVAIIATLVYFLTRAGRSGDEPERRSAVPPSDAEREQAERTRRVQEEIRRKIAERRGASEDVIVVENEPAPPVLESPSGERPMDPLGGPLRRVVREFEQAAERWREPEPDAAQARAAELQRQARLAEELRAMHEQRAAEARRTAERAAAAVAASMRRPVSLTGGGRPTWVGRLHDPGEVRRAVVLREILGPPVALR